MGAPLHLLRGTWEKGEGEALLNGYRVPSGGDGNIVEIVLMVAQPRECNECHPTVCSTTVKIANVMLHIHIFYHTGGKKMVRVTRKRERLRKCSVFFRKEETKEM